VSWLALNLSHRSSNQERDVFGARRESGIWMGKLEAILKVTAKRGLGDAFFERSVWWRRRRGRPRAGCDATSRSNSALEAPKKLRLKFEGKSPTSSRYSGHGRRVERPIFC